MTTIFWAIMVDLAYVLILTRIESQPGAAREKFVGVRMHPDIALADVLEDFGPIVLPPVYFGLAGRQPALGVFNATFATLITGLHG